MRTRREGLGLVLQKFLVRTWKRRDRACPITVPSENMEEMGFRCLAWKGVRVSDVSHGRELEFQMFSLEGS